MHRLQIGVCGSVDRPEHAARLRDLAKQVGAFIAKSEAVLVFGANGKEDHLPHFAHKGTMENGGTAVAIVEGNDRTLYNEEHTIVIPSGETGSRWEVSIALACDVLIVIGGAAGTLQEMVTAYKAGIPIIALKGTGGCADAYGGKFLDMRERASVIAASDAGEAVELATQHAKQILQHSQ